MQEVNHQLFYDSVKNECLLANEEVSEQEIRELLEKFDLEDAGTEEIDWIRSAILVWISLERS